MRINGLIQEFSPFFKLSFKLWQINNFFSHQTTLLCRVPFRFQVCFTMQSGFPGVPYLVCQHFVQLLFGQSQTFAVGAVHDQNHDLRETEREREHNNTGEFITSIITHSTDISRYPRYRWRRLLQTCVLEFDDYVTVLSHGPYQCKGQRVTSRSHCIVGQCAIIRCEH